MGSEFGTDARSNPITGNKIQFDRIPSRADEGELRFELRISPGFSGKLFELEPRHPKQTIHITLLDGALQGHSTAGSDHDDITPSLLEPGQEITITGAGYIQFRNGLEDEETRVRVEISPPLDSYEFIQYGYEIARRQTEDEQTSPSETTLFSPPMVRSDHEDDTDDWQFDPRKLELLRKSLELGIVDQEEFEKKKREIRTEIVDKNDHPIPEDGKDRTATPLETGSGHNEPTQNGPAPGVADTPLGLNPNVVGALTYSLGFVSALIVLGLETENEFVRFHAFQSLLLFGGIFAFSVLALLIDLSMVPLVGGLLLLLSLLLDLLAIPLWIVLLFKTYRGKTIKLPIIGDKAHQYA